MYETSAHRCLACEDVIAQTTAHLYGWLPRVFSLLFHKNQLDDHFYSIARLSPMIPWFSRLIACAGIADFGTKLSNLITTGHMGHIYHLRKLNTVYFYYFIMLIKRRKTHIIYFMRIKLESPLPKDALCQFS